ncbi:MAG TPA: NBR1-Ig-like domain-containing protein [Anaerolineales bacterium]|nr:NBR1-Ig-like domain-containing protein [Anaerolineales bacterium]
MFSQKNTTIYLLLCTAILFSACGAPAQTESDIATAVAQTVQAQKSLTKVSDLPTLTPAPTLPAPSTPEAPTSETPASTSAGNPGCVASAQLVAENPPDETLLSPGEYFWKTWTFLNTGTCYWTTEYSLVFWDGERMGGLPSYPFSKDVPPGETFDISVYLQAPTTEGITSGYWRFKTPWGEYFGVGPQNLSFYVQVNVSAAAKLKYEVTSVTYKLDREPETGCPLNVLYTVTAFVTTNGPTDFDYRWDQSDGNESGIRHYEVEAAETVTFKREWLISLNDNPVPRWINFLITGPKAKDFGNITWEHDCLKK